MVPECFQFLANRLPNPDWPASAQSLHPGTPEKPAPRATLAATPGSVFFHLLLQVIFHTEVLQQTELSFQSVKMFFFLVQNLVQ